MSAMRIYFFCENDKERLELKLNVVRAKESLPRTGVKGSMDFAMASTAGLKSLFKVLQHACKIRTTFAKSSPESN